MKQRITINKKEIHHLHAFRNKLPLVTPSYSWISGMVSCCFWIIVIISLITIHPPVKQLPVKIYSIAIQPSQYIPITHKDITQKEDTPQKTKPEEKRENIAELKNNTPKKIYPIKQSPPPPKKEIITTPIQLSEIPDPPKQSLNPPTKIFTPLHKVDQIPPTAISSIQLDNLKSNYWSVVSSAITRNLRYPIAARMQKIEGNSSIQISINSKGHLLNATIQSASRKMFASAVLAATKRAAPFAPPPHQLSNPLIVKIPVSFRLN